VSDLVSELLRLEGKSYPAYRDLRGRVYRVGSVQLCLAHVQGDPFASPSRLRVELPSPAAAIPPVGLSGGDARRATADFVHRAIRSALARRGGSAGNRPRRRGGGADREASGDRRGSGKSGLIEIADLGQEVLDRTAVRVDSDGSVLIRLAVGLPAAGRRVLGRAAAALLGEKLPAIVSSVFESLDHAALRRHVRVVEDQVAARVLLSGADRIAFVADGAVLPRSSGADDRPLAGAVPFAAPESLRIEMDLPHAGRVSGLGIRRGVTLIVGGGYHGKSTLLQVLSRGVYDHVPGDGRELCVSVADAVSVRAEDGRAVRGVDLRPFIANLPLGRSTEFFDSDDASGSTSQAAAIVEALEVGATALLIDEDTAATNFMIRDARMRALIPSIKEPITPFIDRVRQLADEKRVSSVLVVGGAGDYLDVADSVIQMEDYRPLDVSERARAVVTAMPLDAAARPRSPGEWPAACARITDSASLDPSRGRRGERVRGVKTRAIEFGREEIDVSLLGQLVDAAQCRMIGDVLLELSRGVCDGKRSIAEVLAIVEARIVERGIESFAAASFGDRAAVRRFEIAAALNRLRSLRV